MKQEPKVMKLYAKHITCLFDMPRAAQKVLGYILDRMNDDNEITIAGGGRTMMLDRLDMNYQTASNTLVKLIKSGILASPAKGVYIANPEIFTYKRKWGDTLNQQRKFKAMIEYRDEYHFSIKGVWDKK
jgi:hypothetical protein